MRRYYDAQGNQTGTSQGTLGRVGAGCLGIVLLAILIGVIAGALGH